MGILELHFHESDFNFAPSVGASDEADESSSEDGTMLEPDSESGDSGIGALVALGMLVALGLLVGMRRRRNGDEEGGEYGEDEEISISA
jgi:LPXTG-motif cell wall-anchored protein